jgi:hypothetical protein
MNHLPQAPENNIRPILNFSKILGDIRKRWCTIGVNDTVGKFMICEYLCEFLTKFETALMVYSGAWGN